MQFLFKLLTRAVVGAATVIVFFSAAYLGGWAFFAVIAVLTVAALGEYYWALRRKQVRPNTWLGWGCALLILAIVQRSEFMRSSLIASEVSQTALGMRQLNVVTNALHLTLLVLLFCVAGTLVGQFRRRPGESAVANSAATVFGVVYIGLLFSFTLHMRYVDVPALTGQQAPGEIASRLGALIFVIAPVWLSDTAAYIVGSLWGRVKLAPAISPGKTVEGSVAGLLAAIAGALLVGDWLGMSALHAGLLGGLMGVIGQIGDLSKSVLKRDIGIKDFGGAFGPHGGVLDRFDSTLFCMPLVYWYFWFVIMRMGVV